MKQFNLFLAVLLISFSSFGSYVIPNGGVTTAKIANGAVTNAKILSGDITTAKIADGAVTPAKLSSLGQQLSSSSGSFTSTSLSFTDVTNLSVTITTTGRPVYLTVIADGTGSSGSIGCQTSSSICSAILAFNRAGSDIAYYDYSHSVTGSTANSVLAPIALAYVDVVAAGTYTYKIRAAASLGSTPTVKVLNMKLLAFEL